jgi:hypothetical protein
VRVTRRGHRLTVRVRGAQGRHVRVLVRHKKRLVARRKVRTRHHRARVRIRVPHSVHGRVRVVVLDPGPPPRTARARKRLP